MVTETIILIAVIIIIFVLIVTNVRVVPKGTPPKQSSSSKEWTQHDYNKLIESLGGKEIYYGNNLLNFIVNGDRRNEARVIITYERIARRYVEEDRDVEEFIQNELPSGKYTNKTYQEFISEIYAKGHKRIALNVCKKVVVKYL